MAKPWDIPLFPDQGDSDHDTVYLSVGRALSNWERLEERLAFLYVKFLTAKDIVPAFRAFGAVDSFQTRKEMLNAAMMAFLNEKKNPEFLKVPVDNFIKAMNNYVARRNEIAHGIVKHYQKADWNESVKNGYVLAPHHHNPKKQKIGGTYPVPIYLYSSKEIDYFSDRFFEIDSLGIDAHHALRDFNKENPKE